jgi:ubiquinone/menaquinone biosynthesis C-methylase UbiE
MAISKGWKWEVLSKDDEYWNTPDFMMHYLHNRWKKSNFDTFLDIGCGLGRHSIYMAENGFNVYGIDSSNYVIDTVKEKAYLKGLDIKLSVGDISSLPYENESVDCIAAIGVLSNSDKSGISIILKEMHRVLREGGETYFNIISKISDMGNNEELINGNSFYTITEEDFGWLFKDFSIISIKHIDELYNSMEASSYCVLLKKVNKNNTFNDDKLKDNVFLL